MSHHETSPFQEDLISNEAREFAACVFARFPDFKQYASVERMDSTQPWTLIITVPAPSGDDKATLMIWDPGDDPSIAFGRWHTHEDVELWGKTETEPHGVLLDLVAGILAERFVLCEGLDDGEGWGTQFLDLSVEDAILDELTSKHRPDKIQLRSWTGRLSRKITLYDMKLEGHKPDGDEVL